MPRWTKPGKPLLFGKGGEQGLRFTPDSIEVCEPKNATVWKADGDTGANAFRICQGAEAGKIPVPIGIFRQVDRPQLDESIHQQVEGVTADLGEGTLESLLQSGDTWTV